MASRASSKHVLITGATGMVGSATLFELMRRGVSTAVLVRRRGKWDAGARLQQILDRFDPQQRFRRNSPVIIEGDLNSPQLGLDESTLRWIQEHCDTVLHSAASLDFSPASENPDNEPIRTNVGGTENVLKLCRQCDVSTLHHVSTAYVCGHRSGSVLESENNVGQQFANDYERSKSLAEAMVHAAPIQTKTIYRPSIVIDRTGMAPVSSDRTIYGFYSMYQMLSSRFGLPEPNRWMSYLGMTGEQRKNLVDLQWIAQTIATVICSPQYQGRTYHLTSSTGTPALLLNNAFRTATEAWLERKGPRVNSAESMDGNDVSIDLEQLVEPFVNTFKPYFRDDPHFDRSNIDALVEAAELPPPPEIGREELLELIDQWNSPARPGQHEDDLMICGMEVRLSNGVDRLEDFRELLWQGRSAIAPMPVDRLDRNLYFDRQRGLLSKTYTELGGCVATDPLCPIVERHIQSIGEFDLLHRQFAQVAVAAVAQSLGIAPADVVESDESILAKRLSIDPTRAGIFIGHSGGTELGGSLAMGTMATAVELRARRAVSDVIEGAKSSSVLEGLAESIRRTRPVAEPKRAAELEAYAVAKLAAGLIGAQGRREVIDAACSSSLLALQHAAESIAAGRLDAAIVGGATFNNVDNLALFSQSQACSDQGSFPFDRRASGLVSSEGYVAIVLVRRSVSERAGLPILAQLASVGVSSDGKGKGLWAPRSEGQQLAMRRAYGDNAPLEIDYLECHATSTQVGDATELESLRAILSPANHLASADQSSVSIGSAMSLPIGSVKSNLGHLLESAGLVGLVKCVLAMREGQIPPSINFQTPNDTIDWKSIPVGVVDRVQTWVTRQPKRKLGKKRAAVNAFGIGGLNAHAVIEQNAASGKSVPRIADKAGRSKVDSKRLGRLDEPIAIVGRGCVLPGVANVEQFAEMLRSGVCQIDDPPPNRRCEADALVAPHRRGGYVRDFKFDAQSYRIPPKLVQYANPAQLMLIEAVRQAIGQWDGGKWSVDRQRVGVVIGTIFGGQFSNELQIGLRLPEIQHHVTQLLRRNGISPGKVEELAALVGGKLLEQYPAIKDETGGFTSSTLASRIARTFDLMGGACAVDADEASGGLALMTAIEQLQSGKVDAMLCGVSHRAMDAVAFEQLYRKNRLVNSGMLEDLPDDGSRVFPSEGVAIIVLRRLSDARRNGETIHGLITSIREGFSQDTGAARREEYRRVNDSTLPPLKLLQQFGHFGGGQGIVRLIALSTTNVPNRALIREVAQDGYNIEYDFTTTEHQPMTLASTNRRTSQPQVVVDSTPNVMVSIRLQTADNHSLADALQAMVQSPREHWRGVVDQFANHVDDTASAGTFAQAAMVADDDEGLRRIAGELLAGPVANGQTAALPQSTGWVRLSGNVSSHRVGWLFPGQGSQYSDLPDCFSIAEEFSTSWMRHFDEHLLALNLEPLSRNLADPDGRLGRDVWWTQLWVLGVGSLLADSLRRRGHRPDVVLGHSFGECTAAWAAGAMTTAQAILFARRRSDSVVMTSRVPGQLLSVRGEPTAVDAALRGKSIQTVVTHHNSPTQTVIAGLPDDIAQARQSLHAAGLASAVIAVPAAYHTPAMQAAESMLRSQLERFQLRPPTCSFMSALSNRYLAEPAELLENLISQLTRPVCFRSAVERLIADGCGLLIEVGPGDVLTRMARETASGRAICLSADDRRFAPVHRMALIDLANEAFRGSVTQPAHAVEPRAHQAVPTVAHASENGFVPPVRRFEIVDVTHRGSASKAAAKPAATAKPFAVAEPLTPIERMPAINGEANHHSNGYQAVSVNGHATSIPAANSIAPATASAELDPETVRTFLLDLVIDLTGYDPEIIDMDADLEGELGVDSIKKAQLLGELEQRFALGDLRSSNLRLSDFPTLLSIESFVLQQRNGDVETEKKKSQVSPTA